MSTDLLAAIVLFLLVSSAVILLTLAFWKKKDRAYGEEEETAEPQGTNCPLCGEFLTRGKRVFSERFPGKNFDLMRIYGCPCCRNGKKGHLRRCPCCGEVLPPGGYVMAQVYSRPGKKPHVQVYGCTCCKPGRG